MCRDAVPGNDKRTQNSRRYTAPVTGEDGGMQAANERFRKKRWRSRVTSNRGFSVEIAGRTGLNYRDAAGSVRLDSESRRRPFGVALFVDHVPDDPSRPKAEVLDNVTRAFASAGWHLEIVSNSD